MGWVWWWPGHADEPQLNKIKLSILIRLHEIIYEQSPKRLWISEQRYILSFIVWGLGRSKKAKIISEAYPIPI